MDVRSEDGRAAGSRRSGTLYDVLELVLDRGLVIDAFVRVSLVGVELLRIDVRVVVASVDTYLRFAEACNRLDLDTTGAVRPQELRGQVAEQSARGAGRGAATAAVGAAREVWQELTGGSERRTQQKP